MLDVLSGHLRAVQSSHRGRMLAVRGRRQVGKSTVVERFVDAAETPYAFVTGVYQAPAVKQLEDATRAMGESRHPVPDLELLTQTPATSWREWFSRLGLAARSGPVIAVLDEFPWLVGGDRTLEGELQAAWDRSLERLPVLLILVGSDVAMMDSLASHGRPLFGRVSPLVIPALDPGEVADALPGRSAVEVFDASLVTGGYPRLVLDLAASGLSADDYVRRALRDAYSPLVTTGRLTLDAEFPEPQTAYRVLSAIGSSDTANPGFTDVVGAIADPGERQSTQVAITRALATLTGTKAMIEKELPAWAPPSSKLRRYRVTDPYLRFWFRYVERYIDPISRGRADLAIDAFDRDWTSWRGQSIEPIVRHSLQCLALHDPRLAGVETVLPWWNRSNVEIDVVAATRAGTPLVGTIKWRTGGPVTSAEVNQLRQQRTNVPHAEEALVAAISPSGEAVGADVTFSADELLAAW
ncbi:ArsR family transcriptional regulator [Cellulomonas composti]|uniref:ArsR family transcriptional regulator n=2 Tax=Cellulomonas composti TaxID=266130 RepID=A0A511J9J2_9CELL|nr:ArsR family transcriptional regulator [Cellulomonas composti]